ncbi:hypothetical protein ACO0LO_01995 [Undibacterium sp. TJN25]|uniref:hypothetical protein n=1 Tax=Undibacterium sp. TJN25 TaxID=3413056 RepID=UPI003BF1B4D1
MNNNLLMSLVIGLSSICVFGPPVYSLMTSQEDCESATLASARGLSNLQLGLITKENAQSLKQAANRQCKVSAAKTKSGHDLVATNNN